MRTRAAYITALGGPEQIHVDELEVPTIGPTDVLVRVLAVEVNRVDTYVRSGAYKTPTPFPFIIGRDLVGEVAEHGPGACSFAAGQRVWCNSLGHGGRQGSFAELVVVEAERLYHLPDGVDPVEAVAVLHGAGTACLGLFREARLQPADTVVIGGGAGAVGAAAVQLAARTGARVLATAAAEDAQRCIESGAAAVFDFGDPDLIGKLRDSAPDGVAVYWDTSGHQDLDMIEPLLSVGARVILTAAANPRPVIPATSYYTSDVSVHGFAISNATVGELAEAARVTSARLADGTLKGHIGELLPLAAAADAQRHLEADSVDGRIVLTP